MKVRYAVGSSPSAYRRTTVETKKCYWSTMKVQYLRRVKRYQLAVRMESFVPTSLPLFPHHTHTHTHTHTQRCCFQTASGKWKVESGKWKVESGKWKVLFSLNPFLCFFYYI
jgi:hypothetical protein